MDLCRTILERISATAELIPLALNHSHALRCCYVNFYRQGTMIIADGVTRVLEIYQMIRNYGVTALDLSPSAAAVLLRLTRGCFSEFDGQLDYIQLGTASLPEGIKEELVVTEIPRTANGKIRRGELRRVLGESGDGT